MLTENPIIAPRLNFELRKCQAMFNHFIKPAAHQIGMASHQLIKLL